MAELLQMTGQAQELLSEFGMPQRLRQLLVDMRSRAREEGKRLSHHRKGTRYDLCLIGIIEEFYFLDKTDWETVVGLDLRLSRIREEIERTMQEIKAKRKIM